MKLTEIKEAIMNLTNLELYELKEMIDLEINLSEKCIESGEEERK